MTKETIADRIEQAALDGVQSFTVDGMSGTAMSIADLILAARHKAQQDSASKNHMGFHIVKLVNPGGGGQ